MSVARAVTQWTNTDHPAEWVEVMALGVNKGVAVRRLAVELGVRLEEFICIGDGINDLDMLQIPDVFSVVVGHSPYPSVRETADFTANAVDAELPGVAQVIRKHVLVS